MLNWQMGTMRGNSSVSVPGLLRSLNGIDLKHMLVIFLSTLFGS